MPSLVTNRFLRGNPSAFPSSSCTLASPPGTTVDANRLRRDGRLFLTLPRLPVRNRPRLEISSSPSSKLNVLYTSPPPVDGVLNVPPMDAGMISLRYKLIVPKEFISERHALDELGRQGKTRGVLRCELESDRRRLRSTKLNDNGRKAGTG